jgi:hypothetical protein
MEFTLHSFLEIKKGRAELTLPEDMYAEGTPEAPI